MTFETVGNGGNCGTCWWTKAEGVITADTPDVFARFAAREGGGVLVFDSPGGDLSAALELGRLIRENGFATGIGRSNLKYPGSIGGWVIVLGRCESACLFAFMGGTAREVRINDMAIDGDYLDAVSTGRLGTHRFFRRTGREIPSAATQAIMGQLLDYVLEMGIHPKVLARASKTDETLMYVFSEEEFREYRLVTDARNTPKRLRITGGGLALHWMHLRSDGTPDRDVHLFCKLGGWHIHVRDVGSAPASLGFERGNPRGTAFRAGGQTWAWGRDDLIYVEKQGEDWVLEVRLPVQLEAIVGQEFSLVSSQLRNWATHLSAHGVVPGAETLALLKRACLT